MAAAILALVVYSVTTQSVLALSLEETGRYIRLPFLTNLAITIVGYTPAFIVGATPAIYLTIASAPRKSEVSLCLRLSGITLGALLLWISVLWLGLDNLQRTFDKIQ